MTDARALVCPSCGASVLEGARHCRHCDAAVATARCANCYWMSSPDAVHCSACGRGLGLEPAPCEGTLDCPDCRQSLTAFACGPGLLHDCGRCGGQFVELAALRDLLERHDRYDAVLGRPRGVPGRASIGPVRYIACPACGAMMNRRNFGGTSGVVVDVCARHGTWFDSGELPRVLAFVENGGLSRAREREAAEREAKARDGRVHDRVSVTALPHVSSGAVGFAERGRSLLDELFADLFGD